MSKFCENCGTKLDDNMDFCPECGTKVNTNKDFESETELKTDETLNKTENCQKEVDETPANMTATSSAPLKKKKKTGLIILIICLCLIGIGGGSYFIIYPKVVNHMEQKKNEEKAEKVINLINSTTKDQISLDSEKNLDTAKKEYDSLSGKQKKLVKNYKKLTKAYKSLTELKNAQQIIDALDAVDKNSLSADDTSVQDIRNNYDKLTDAEKKLVTNSDKLTEYEKIIQDKQNEKQAQENAKAQSEQKTQTQTQSSPAPEDELLSLVGKDEPWYDFGVDDENQYEKHMRNVISPYVNKLMDNYSFWPGTTMISISEQDRNQRTYFVLIHDDLNTGSYAGFIVNLNNDSVTFSQNDSNISM